MTPVRQRAADKLPAYVLRDIPEDLWDRVKARTAEDGHSIRWVALRLFEFYAKQGLPKGKPSNQER